MIPTANSPIGRALRLPLRAIPRATRVPILSGPARGLRWIVGAGVHGYWIGSYEIEKARAFERLLTPDDVVYDLGAHVGYYSLIASRTARRVYAFEPMPRNLRYLEAHLALNEIRNVEVVAAAVAGSDGIAWLSGARGSSQNRLEADGSIQVETLGLDGFRGEPPSLVKMDIEGQELAALQGGERLLRTHHPTICLSTHGEGLHRDCAALLRELGYAIEEPAPDEILARAP